MKQKNKNKGITLIALVITIILLLILAGVTIGQLRGNGLFDKVKLAKEKSDEAQAKENATLGDYENKIDEIVGSRENINMEKQYNNFKEKIAEGITNKGIKTSKDDSEETILENLGKISSNIQITEFGTIETGIIGPGSAKQLVINLENTYTEEDHAMIIIYNIENKEGALTYYDNAQTHKFIIGNTIPFYVFNGSGSTNGSSLLSYCMITNLDV